MVASLKSWGTSAVVDQILQKSCKSLFLNVAPPYFQTSGDIPSGPAAFLHSVLLMAISSSSAVGGSSMWYLTGSCGMLLAPSSAPDSGFSRRLKCSLHLSIILPFSV